MTKFILLFMGLTCLFSCKSFLETEPTDFVVPELYYSNETELQAALDGVYSQLTHVDCYGNNYLYIFNVNTDESYDFNVKLETSYQYDAAYDKLNLFWQSCYIAIERANLLLENVDKPTMNESRRQIIKGEALFLRAYFYFLLVSNYGDVPLKLSSTSSVSEVDIARTASKEVYAQIIHDMEIAEGLLASQTVTSLGYGGKVTKTAVEGILSRVCLYMAGYPVNDQSKYQEASDWAKKVIESGEHALNPDYAQIYLNYATDKYDTKESIWELEFYRNNDGLTNKGGTYAGRWCGIRCSDANIGFSTGSIVATRYLYDLYEIDPESESSPNKGSLDLRRDWACANYNWGTKTVGVKTAVTNIWQMCAGKWRREYEVVIPKNSNYTPQNFPLLRYSDVLLMYAEAENAVHNGPTSEAYDAINTVRRRAYGFMLPSPPHPNAHPDLAENLSKDQFLQAIKEERARELCFEALRKPDLIRWGNFIGDMKNYLAYARANGGTTLAITTAATAISDRNLLLPIPSYELSLNKLVTQNTGY
ncbi:Starch-binding associating with outer membrane [bacterium A37T11]|nr:Starch-binding associating with outer membrane [bacterium A37T11]